MSMQAQHRTIEAPKLFVLGPADPLLHRFRIPQKGGSEREGKNTFYKLKLNLEKLKKKQHSRQSTILIFVFIQHHDNNISNKTFQM